MKGKNQTVAWTQNVLRRLLQDCVGRSGAQIQYGDQQRDFTAVHLSYCTSHTVVFLVVVWKWKSYCSRCSWRSRSSISSGHCSSRCSFLALLALVVHYWYFDLFISSHLLLLSLLLANTKWFDLVFSSFFLWFFSAPNAGSQSIYVHIISKAIDRSCADPQDRQILKMSLDFAHRAELWSVCKTHSQSFSCLEHFHHFLSCRFLTFNHSILLTNFFKERCDSHFVYYCLPSRSK